MEIANTVRLVLVGRTGNGRSSIGNLILNKECFRRCIAPYSVTEKCFRGETIRHGENLIIIDTPGLFHTKITQDTIKKEIAKSIDLLSPGPQAFLYVLSISRHCKEEEQTPVELEKIFGNNFFKYCIVLFVTDTTVGGRNIDKVIETLPYFFRDLVAKCNGRVITFCEAVDNSEDMCVQIRRFLQEIAQQQPAYYSSEMLTKHKSKLNRVFFRPTLSILCWLKQRKNICFVVIALFVFGCNYYLSNTSTNKAD